MRSCCEKTLGVLRENKESLITIIEVKPSCTTQMPVCAAVMVTTATSCVCNHLPRLLSAVGAAAVDLIFRTDSISLLHSIAW